MRILLEALAAVRQRAAEIDMAPPAAGPEVQVTFRGATERQVADRLEGLHVDVLAIRTRGWL